MEMADITGSFPTVRHWDLKGNRHLAYLCRSRRFGGPIFNVAVFDKQSFTILASFFCPNVLEKPRHYGV